MPLALSLASAVLAPSSWAQKPDAKPAPVDRFRQAAEAYREGRFQDAVDLLIEERKLHPEPVLLYNLARAYEGLGRSDEAAVAYAQYLQEAPDVPDRKAVEARIATLKSQAEALRRAKEAKGREDDRVVAVPPPPSKEEPARQRSVAPWVLGGAGLAVAGGGLAFGLLAQSRNDDAAADPVQRSARAARDDAERFATFSTIGWIAGGVLVASAAVWLLLRPAERPSTARVRVVPGGLAF